MPELPESEITARLVGEAVAGARVESAFAPGVNVMKSFRPPLDDLAGSEIAGIRRRGKLLTVDFSSELSLLIHQMSAGKLRLYEKRASSRDRSSRILLRLEGGRELRLRETGTRQRAWAKLLPSAEVDADEAIATLGPDAWPDPVPAEALSTTDRPLYSLLRDQRTLAGIGRAWADEILWQARLSPFKRASDLEDGEVETLGAAIHDRLDAAVAFYVEELELPLPDKLPRPLEVHGREGEACRRCGAEILAVHYSEYVLCYCPEEQTGGQPLKDRRLSRLLNKSKQDRSGKPGPLSRRSRSRVPRRSGPRRLRNRPSRRLPRVRKRRVRDRDRGPDPRTDEPVRFRLPRIPRIRLRPIRAAAVPPHSRTQASP